MEATYLVDLVQEAMANINLLVVIALMGIGALIKHVKWLDKIPNDFIPPILIVFGIALTYLQQSISIESTVSAIVSCTVAVGAHQTGKNIFTISIIPKVLELLTNSNSNNE